MYKSVKGLKLKYRKSLVIKKSNWKRQERDYKGRFDSVITETLKQSSRDSLNCRDFKSAKEKLLAIQSKLFIFCQVHPVYFKELFQVVATIQNIISRVQNYLQEN